MLDIHKHLRAEDQAYFRASREKRLGMTLEQAHAQRDEWLPRLRTALAPLRLMLASQPFICGDAPAFSDYVAFGVFQWARVISDYTLLESDDPEIGRAHV